MHLMLPISIPSRTGVLAVGPYGFFIGIAIFALGVGSLPLRSGSI